MKILHLISSSGFFGAEAVVLNLLSKIKEEGQTGHLVCLKNAGRPDPELFVRAREEEIPASVISCKTKFDLAAIRKLQDYISDNKIEIIHAHGYKSDLYGLIVSRALKIPLVSTLHGWTGENGKVRIYGLIDRCIIKCAHHIVSVSPAISEELERLNINNSRISFIPNGVDVDYYCPPRRRKNLRSHLYLRKKFVIGVVGRLSVEKGHRYLIDALKEVKKNTPDIQVLIIGDGPLKGKLQDRVHALGLSDSVIFTGFQDNMPSLYKDMDIFVLPSLTEGVPMALLEAMSLELPVVATRVGGVPFVLGDAEGILVDAGKSKELADAIVSLVRNPSLRGKYGKNGRVKVVKEFSLDVCYMKYKKVYEKVLRQCDAVKGHGSTGAANGERFMVNGGRRTVDGGRLTVDGGRVAKNLRPQTADRKPQTAGIAPKTNTNILTVDVEEYFQVENFKNIVKTSDWDRYESRVAQSTERVLRLLKEAGAKATFFILGWIAERHADLVRKICQAGHEIASHGYGHELIYNQTPDDFREDIRKAKLILEDIAKQTVLGYRAPSYSITKRSMWALEILLEEGFKYDSSIFPIRHDRGGLPEAQRYPYRIYNHRDYMWEFPLSTRNMGHQNIPFSGGGYFRLLPYRFVKKSIRKINDEGHPAIIYIHPWELDEKQPRINAGTLNTFRHYVNIRQTENKLRQLLNDFKFTSIREYKVVKNLQ